MFSNASEVDINSTYMENKDLNPLPKEKSCCCDHDHTIEMKFKFIKNEKKKRVLFKMAEIEDGGVIE
jgi:hypothetical protein